MSNEDCPNCSAYLEGSAEWEDEARRAKIRIRELEAELIERKINLLALENSNRKLNEANARIVEFEDIKKGHLEVQKKMREMLQETAKSLWFYADPHKWFTVQRRSENVPNGQSPERDVPECSAMIKIDGGDIAREARNQILEFLGER